MTAGESLPDMVFGHVKSAELGRAGLAVTYAETFDQPFLHQFHGRPLRQSTLDGGDVHALPWTAQMSGLFVNDRIMGELGLAMPETWDQLTGIAPAVREAGRTPIASGNLARDLCPDVLLPLVNQHGGDVCALDDMTTEGVTWDSPPVVDSLMLLRRLAQAGMFLDVVNGIHERPAWQIAYRGRALMLYTGFWAPAIFAAEATEDWNGNHSVQKVPAVTADGIRYTGNGSGEGWGAAAGSPNRDLTPEFIQRIRSPELYDRVQTAFGALPAMTTADQVTDPVVGEMLG